ncbi:MAG: acyl carrier protein [Pseudomonadota bacterium]
MAVTLTMLRSVLAEEFEIEPDAVQLEADLFADLDIDSIDAIDMLARLRELTGSELSTDDLKSVRTVADILDIVSSD